jgi:hypothetical protein
VSAGTLALIGNLAAVPFAPGHLTIWTEFIP